MNRRKVAAAYTALTCKSAAPPLPATCRTRADLRGNAATRNNHHTRRTQHMTYRGLFRAATATGNGSNDHMAETCRDEGCRRLPCVIFKRGYDLGFEAGSAAGYAAGFAAGVASAAGGGG